LYLKIWDSSTATATRPRGRRYGEIISESTQGQEIFISSEDKPALGHTQPHI